MAFTPRIEQNVKLPIPTEEQLLIMEEAKRGSNIAIKAFAGCTKTTTCQLIASVVHETSLYIAFNKSIADEAGTKFPNWVECRTLHSLAYQSIVKGTPFGKKGKLVGFYSFKDAAKIISSYTMGMPEGTKNNFVNDCLALIKNWCNSSYHTIEDFFICGEKLDEAELSLYGPPTMLLWNIYSNPNSEVTITHDIYLKLFQLSKPDLSRYKLIYLDEFQDTNPVCLDIFLSQKNSQLIAVGDPYQSIYSWRGAVNAFHYIDDSFKHLYLTESFRLNEQTCDSASKVLELLNESRRISGKGRYTEVQTKAFIVRNNLTMFSFLLETAYRSEKAYVVGDLSDLFSALYTAQTLAYTRKGEKPNYKYNPHPQIASYDSWEELVSANSQELRKIVTIIENYGSNLHGSITDIKNCLVQEQEQADVIVCTGHKSKGLEFDHVTLADDFVPFLKEDDDKEEKMIEFLKGQGLELLYVAMTRAKVKLQVPPRVWEYLEEIKDFMEQ